MKILEVCSSNPQRHIIQSCTELEKLCFGEKSAFNAFVMGAAALAGSLMALMDEQGQVLGSAVFFQGAPAAELTARVDWAQQPGLAQNSVYLASLCVHPDHRGRGIGRRLLKEALVRLCDKSINLCWMTVSPDNMEALALYESEGFVRAATLNDLYGPGEHRHILLRRLDCSPVKSDQ